MRSRLCCREGLLIGARMKHWHPDVNALAQIIRTKLGHFVQRLYKELCPTPHRHTGSGPLQPALAHMYLRVRDQMRSRIY